MKVTGFLLNDEIITIVTLTSICSGAVWVMRLTETTLYTKGRHLTEGKLEAGVQENPVGRRVLGAVDFICLHQNLRVEKRPFSGTFLERFRRKRRSNRTSNHTDVDCGVFRVRGAGG